MPTDWIKDPDELAKLMVCMSFGGMNEVAECLSEMIKDRETGNPDFDVSDKVEIADLLWSWATGRVEALEEDRRTAEAARAKQPPQGSLQGRLAER